MLFVMYQNVKVESYALSLNEAQRFSMLAYNVFCNDQKVTKQVKLQIFARIIQHLFWTFLFSKATNLGGTIQWCMLFVLARRFLGVVGRYYVRQSVISYGDQHLKLGYVNYYQAGVSFLKRVNHKICLCFYLPRTIFHTN